MTSHDDVPTVCAIAVLAMVVATAAHEAAGHGGACLLSGGNITRLTSVFFECAPSSRWIAMAGPLGNLACGMAAFAGLRLLPARAAMGRLFAFLAAAFSFYWFAGYLVYAMALNTGDFAFAFRAGPAPLPPVARIAGMGLGMALYLLTARLLARENFRRGVQRLAWTAATAAATLAALLYAPDRIGAAVQALLEIGAASLPLFRRTVPDGASIARSPAWIGACVILFAGFAFTLGRGIG